MSSSMEVSSSSIPPRVEVKSILLTSSSMSSGASGQVQPKKKLMFRTPRHPRYDSVEASNFVYNYKRLAQPINALAPSKSSKTPFSSRLGIVIPQPILRSFSAVEPLFLPLLFPLGLLSAVFQSLPMALSIIPLSIVAGIAGVFIIPLMCLGGISLSAWIVFKALAKLLRTQSQLARSKSAKLALLCTSLCISGLSTGASAGSRGIAELKRAGQVLMMGLIGLGALATYDPERSQPPSPSPEKESTAKPKNVTEDISSSLPKVSTEPPSVVVPSSPTPSTGLAKSKAQGVFQSILLAQGLPPASLTATVDNQDLYHHADSSTTPDLSPISRTNSFRNTPGSSSSNISSPDGFTFTPMTPMTPSTPHPHSLPLSTFESGFSTAVENMSAVEIKHPVRTGKHVRIADPATSVHHGEVSSSPYAVSGLQAALEKLSTEQVGDLGLEPTTPTEEGRSHVV